MGREGMRGEGIKWEGKHRFRGVTRNLLRGTKEGSGDGSPPAGSRGRAPVGCGSFTPRSRRHMYAEYSTEHSHRSSLIAYCSKSDKYFEKISSYDGGTSTCGTTQLHRLFPKCAIRSTPSTSPATSCGFRCLHSRMIIKM